MKLEMNLGIFWIGLRMGSAVILFLAGLLAVCKPPTYIFWKISIVVMEGGQFLVLPLLLLGLWSLAASGSGRWAGILFILAAGLYATTCIRAVFLATKLEKEFAGMESKGGIKGAPPVGTFRRAAPLSLAEMFTGIPMPAPAFRTYGYKKHGDLDLELDFYPAAGPNGYLPKGDAKDGATSTTHRLPPCVIVIHGGGWDGGARSQLSPLNGFLASEGYAVATLQYRLAPKHQYPAPVEDVADAMAWLRAHAGELSIDTTRFALLGRSAGGQIALNAAYTFKDPSIKGVVAFYAPADMVFGYNLPTNPLIMDSRQLMVQYLGAGYPEAPEKYRASSPIEQIASMSTPTLLLHGRRDVLVSFQHTVHMRAKMESLGVRHFVVDVPWGAHGFDFVFRGPGSQISLYFLERFLADVTQ